MCQQFIGSTFHYRIVCTFSSPQGTSDNIAHSHIIPSKRMPNVPCQRYIYVSPGIRFGDVVHFAASTGKEADSSHPNRQRHNALNLPCSQSLLQEKQFLIGFLQILKLHDNLVVIFLRSHVLLKDFILFFRFVQQECLIEQRKIIPVSFLAKIVQFFPGIFRSLNSHHSPSILGSISGIPVSIEFWYAPCWEAYIAPMAIFLHCSSVNLDLGFRHTPLKDLRIFFW